MENALHLGFARFGLRRERKAVPRKGSRLRILRRVRLGQSRLLFGQRALLRFRAPLRKRVLPDHVRHDGLPIRRLVRSRRAPRRNHRFRRGRALQAAARIFRQEEPGTQDSHR